jgi:hypothetical protein
MHCWLQLLHHRSLLPASEVQESCRTGSADFSSLPQPWKPRSTAMYEPYVVATRRGVGPPTAIKQAPTDTLPATFQLSTSHSCFNIGSLQRRRSLQWASCRAEIL